MKKNFTNNAKLAEIFESVDYKINHAEVGVNDLLDKMKEKSTSREDKVDILSALGTLVGEIFAQGNAMCEELELNFEFRDFVR